MDSEETLKYLQQKYPEDLNENYRCYWWYTSNIDGSALTYYDVQNLDEPVSSTLLKKYLDKMSDSDPIKKMFKQHKNINAYTKWFNTIPLLGTTALGANAYFNNNKDE